MLKFLGWMLVATVAVLVGASAPPVLLLLLLLLWWLPERRS